MSPTSPSPEDVDAVREQRRRVVLRQVRARRASTFARKHAVMRAAVLLRSIGYHDDR